MAERSVSHTIEIAAGGQGWDGNRTQSDTLKKGAGARAGHNWTP